MTLLIYQVLILLFFIVKTTESGIPFAFADTSKIGWPREYYDTSTNSRPSETILLVNSKNNKNSTDNDKLSSWIEKTIKSNDNSNSYNPFLKNRKLEPKDERLSKIFRLGTDDGPLKLHSEISNIDPLIGTTPPEIIIGKPKIHVPQNLIWVPTINRSMEKSKVGVKTVKPLSIFDDAEPQQSEHHWQIIHKNDNFEKSAKIIKPTNFMAKSNPLYSLLNYVLLHDDDVSKVESMKEALDSFNDSKITPKLSPTTKKTNNSKSISPSKLPKTKTIITTTTTATTTTLSTVITSTNRLETTTNIIIRKKIRVRKPHNKKINISKKSSHPKDKKLNGVVKNPMSTPKDSSVETKKSRMLDLELKKLPKSSKKFEIRDDKTKKGNFSTINFSFNRSTFSKDENFDNYRATINTAMLPIESGFYCNVGLFAAGCIRVQLIKEVLRCWNKPYGYYGITDEDGCTRSYAICMPMPGRTGQSRRWRKEAQFRKWIFKCGPGTIFNPELSLCTHGSC